ncbi:MAG: helical backbone metal receptor [Staphylococcus epidermidis]|nr:helical backbone metal receptor [Staphylococcus epidermidis]
MKSKLWIVICALIVVLAACSQDANHSSNNKDTEKSDKKYHRIVSLIPSNTEILYRLGIGEDIVGVSTVDDYPKDVKKGKKQFDAMNLNKEELIKAKPDLILAHESQKNSAGKVLKSLKDKGVKVVYVKDAQSIDETYDTFKSIGKLTDREKQAKELVDETKHNVDKIINSIPKHHKKQVSKESIIKRNPDILISTEGKSKSDYIEMIKKRGGFDKINAVKNTRIETVDGDEVSRPGPRIDEGLKDLKDEIYKK